MAKKEIKVTTIEELLKANEGEIVELPPFSENIPFVARIKRPSMLDLVKEGKIPNQLLVEANNLFAGGPSGVMTKKMSDTSAMTDLFKIMEVICEDAFIEPTYKDMKEAGVKLTDEQIMFVFSYCQKGVTALESFRKQWRSS